MAQTGAVQGRGVARQGGARARLEMFLPPIVGGLVLLVALVGLIGTAIRDPHPHDIPVGLVGPASVLQQMSAGFATAVPGAFRFTSYGSEADARSALDSRAVDGVLVLGGPSPSLIVAGAAGDSSIGVITAAFTNALKAQGMTVTVETVHPFSSGDAHGLILFFVVVAVLVCSLVSQALLTATAKDAGLAETLAVVVTFAVLSGITGMATAAWIAGDYGSGFWLAVGWAALGSAAIGAVVAGLGRLLGPAGIGLTGLFVVLLGLVTSGGPVGSPLLPDFYRTLAPWMPAGPLYSAMRGALYFDGAAIGGPVAVLSGWLVAGVALMLVGEMIERRRAPVAATAG